MILIAKCHHDNISFIAIIVETRSVLMRGNAVVLAGKSPSPPNNHRWYLFMVSISITTTITKEAIINTTNTETLNSTSFLYGLPLLGFGSIYALEPVLAPCVPVAYSYIEHIC